MKKRSFLVILFVSLCIFLLLYPKIHRMSNSLKDTSSFFQKENGLSSGVDRKADGKYASYIELYVFLTGNIEETMGTYFRKLGKEADIKVAENACLFVGFPLKHDDEKLEEVYSYTSSGPSLGEADDSVKKLVPRLRELINTMSEVDSYYKLKSYVDDDFAKGRELHQSIISQYKDIKSLTDEFTKSFDQMLTNKWSKDLDSFKEKDSLISYYALSLIMDSMTLQKELCSQGIHAGNVKDLDIGSFKEKYERLAEDLNKYLEYSKDPDRVKNEGLDPAYDYSMDFKISVMEVKSAATDILLKARQAAVPGNSASSQEFYGGGEHGTPEYYNTKVNKALLEYIHIFMLKD